jgi:hypothetical protein
MIWTVITQALGALVAPVTEAVKGYQERRRVSLEGEVKLAQAKVEAQIAYMKDKQAADIAWENLSIGNSGWKDEWFTIILSIPAILCFIPEADVYVKKGFEALAVCPDWYNWMLGIAVGSAFGVKKITDFMQWKKGA